MPKGRKNRKPIELREKLKGWKGIGAFLGVGAGVAQHWAEKGMPVKKQGRSVVADKQELERWLGKEAHMPGPTHAARGPWPGTLISSQ